MEDYYIGIDIGGTNLRIIKGNGIDIDINDFSIRPLISYPTVDDEVYRNILLMIDKECDIIEKHKKKLSGIGISLAALFNRKDGVIAEWPNRKSWNSYPLKKVITDKYKVPVVLEDDANAAAYGELYFKAQSGNNSFIYISIGTGIGSGLVFEGKIYTGTNGWAGELGHIKVCDQEIKCTCGATGCLQAVASGTAILKKFKNSNWYRDNHIDDKGLVKTLIKLYGEGNIEITNIYKTVGNYIGETIANISIFLDIQYFILGGGVIESAPFLLEYIQETANKTLYRKPNITIECTEIGTINGALGALLLVKEYVNTYSHLSIF